MKPVTPYQYLIVSALALLMAFCVLMGTVRCSHTTYERVPVKDAPGWTEQIKDWQCRELGWRGYNPIKGGCE